MIEGSFLKIVTAFSSVVSMGVMGFQAYIMRRQSDIMREQTAITAQQNLILKEKERKENMELVKDALDARAAYRVCVVKYGFPDEVDAMGIAAAVIAVATEKPEDYADRDCRSTLRKMMLFSEQIKLNPGASEIAKSVHALEGLTIKVDEEGARIFKQTKSSQTPSNS